MASTTEINPECGAHFEHQQRKGIDELDIFAIIALHADGHPFDLAILRSHIIKTVIPHVFERRGEGSDAEGFKRSAINSLTFRHTSRHITFSLSTTHFHPTYRFTHTRNGTHKVIIYLILASIHADVTGKILSLDPMPSMASYCPHKRTIDTEAGPIPPTIGTASQHAAKAGKKAAQEKAKADKKAAADADIGPKGTVQVDPKAKATEKGRWTRGRGRRRSCRRIPRGQRTSHMSMRWIRGSLSI